MAFLIISGILLFAAASLFAAALSLLAVSRRPLHEGSSGQRFTQQAVAYVLVAVSWSAEGDIPSGCRLSFMLLKKATGLPSASSS